MPYPPDDHVLRDLAIEVESRPDGMATGWLRVTPELAGPDGGVEVGALAVLVDVLGGGLSIRAVQPDWAATADLTLQLADAHVPTGSVVEAQARAVRKGRTTLVIEVDVSSGERALGWGSITFAVLQRRDDTLEIPELSDGVTRMTFASERGGFHVPMIDAVGVTVLEPGVVSLPWSPYIRNSFGAVQGGIVAMLGAVAGRTALDDATVLDLHVAYLAQAREGPLVARAEVLAPGAATVRLTDEGAGGRLTTVVHVGTTP